MSKIKVNNIESLTASGTITSNSNLDFQNSYSLINVSGVTAQNVTVLGTLTSAGFAPSGNLTSNGDFQVGTTSVFNIDSANGNTGVSGTLGVVGAVNFGDDLNVSGNLTVSGTTVSLGDFEVGASKMTVDSSTGDTLVAGTLSVTGDIINLGGTEVTVGSSYPLIVSNSDASSSTATGALQVSGGVGVLLDVHVGGDLAIDGSTGTLSVNTDKVVITKSSGDTVIAGTLNASSNKFSVDSSGNINTSGTLGAGGVNFKVDSSGNTTVSGALNVGGVSSFKNTTIDGTLTTKDIVSTNESITAQASESISTGRFVRISGDTVDGLPKVGLVSNDSQTPLAYYSGSTILNTNDKASFIKRGIVNATGFTSASIGEKVYCSNSGTLTNTSTDFLVGFAVEAITNPKVYLNIGGSGGGGVTPTVVTAVPVGSIITGAFTSAPTGYLLCDGSSLSTATYSDLFAAIAYTYGGAGANFNIPDTQGAFLRSAGTSAGYTGAAVTVALGTKTSDAMQGHYHGELTGNYFLTHTTNVSTQVGNGFYTVDNRAPTTGPPVNDGSNSTGANPVRTANETRVKSIAVNYFIKY